MSASRWKATGWGKSCPKCLFCDTPSDPTIILYVKNNAIRGWRCPNCGFTIIHPREIQKAMVLVKEVMKLKI